MRRSQTTHPELATSCSAPWLVVSELPSTRAVSRGCRYLFFLQRNDYLTFSKRIGRPAICSILSPEYGFILYVLYSVWCSVNVPSGFSTESAEKSLARKK
jgi:hypothetical protein